MKKAYSIILILLLFDHVCSAQTDTLLLREANDLFNKGYYETSLPVFQKCLSEALQGRDKKNITAIYLSIGKTYSKLGRSVDAIHHYQLAERTAEDAGDLSSRAKALNNIGALYREQKNFQQALNYHAMAETIAISVKDSLTIADCANDKGIVFEMLKKFDTAETYYKTALDIYKKIHNNQRLSVALNNLGVMHKNMGKYDEALDFYKQAQVIAEQLGDQFVIAANYVNIASVLNKTRLYEEALKYDNYGFAVAERIKALDILVAASENMAVCYEGLNDHKKAYEWHKKFSVYSDSLINIERNKQMADAEAKYQTSQKEKQIQQQKFELTQKSYWLYGSEGLLILLSLLGYSYYRRYRLRQENKLRDTIIKQQDLATRAVLEAEENERKRIAQELHDGVGQMMSAVKMNMSAFEDDIQIKSESQKMAFEKIVSLVDESCREVRSVCHQMMPNALLKNGLANAVREFINKIDSRVLKVDLYSEGLNDRIDANAETVLYRVIQECVNNVIKHSGANHLDISLIKDNDGISVTIEDNGKGFDTSAVDKAEGIGLKNMQTRIGYLKGTIEFDSNPGKGTLVAIHIPI